VLGGGIVPGSLLLIGGEPGVGKSTLLLQVAGGVAAAYGGVLYATGEESAGQVRLRAARLGLGAGPAADAVAVLARSEVGAIMEAARAARPAVVVVDSIQTMTVDELDGPAGSVGQVRESALRLMELAKGEGIAVVLVGHVTKDGSIAGPRTLEHLVDAVIELGGERTLVIGDTVARKVYAYAFDGETGTVGERRVFSDYAALDGAPDGATVDAANGVWSCVLRSGKLVRLTAAGVDRVVALPMANPSDVAFGGPDLRRLFVTSIAVDLGDGPPASEASWLVAVDDLGVTGRPEVRFRL
jgi:KaiC/GvpD/RAD55 family RecA-like ATPase